MSSETASPFNPRILVVGRLSGPKNQVILRYLESAVPAVRGEFPGASFQVLGGPVGEEHRALEARLPSVRFLGHQQALGDFYEKADLVVGSGRVALEAMARKKPVVAVGERQYLGPLSEKTRARALATNFGDCAEREDFDWPRAAADLLGLLRDPARRDETARLGWSLVETEYNMDVVYPQLENLYQDALLDQNLASRHELPVLMYHRLADQAPPVDRYNLRVTAADFEDQLRWLQGWGFTPVTFGDLVEKRAPRKPVILTFDDGYEDNYLYLFPLLKKYGVRAVVYLLGDRSIRRNEWDISQGEPASALLSDAQVLEMAESGLVEFGSHSLDHAKLHQLSLDELTRQVVDSKKNLESLLGRPIWSFAYPYGDLNEAVKEAVRQAGYRFGVAVNSGPTRFGEDLMEIRRVHLFPKTSRWQYWKKTSGFYLRYRRWRAGRRP